MIDMPIQLQYSQEQMNIWVSSEEFSSSQNCSENKKKDLFLVFAALSYKDEYFIVYPVVNAGGNFHPVEGVFASQDWS